MAKPAVLSAERPGIGGGVDADTVVRSVLFLAALLAAWITLHPFQSLAAPPPQVKAGGDVLNQVVFSSLFLSLAAWTYFNEPSRLRLLLRPALILLLLWCALSVVGSWEPALAFRRLAFALVLMSIAAMALLLPKNVRHFSDLMTVVALIVLAACYLGVLLVPKLAIHQATDFLEPEHAGEWRGAFPHKNEAGAAMVLLIFVGMFTARMRSRALGGLIILAASVFLLFTRSKTAIGVLPLVFILSAIINRSRRPAIGIALVVVVLGIFNFLSVGTVLLEPIHDFVNAMMPDATFTGRTAIWHLGLNALAARPVTGYGFGAFWGTPEVVYGLGGHATWANAATDAHNAYLNLALMIGVPGLVLALAWIVILPILDFYRCPHAAYDGPMETLFLRICLYGIYASSFESAIFQQTGDVWFMYMTAAFGLRYLSVARATP